MHYRNGYVRLSRMSGLLQNPVASNKQVVKLNVHSLLRGGNKVVKLYAISPAATHAHIKRLVVMFVKKMRLLSFIAYQLMRFCLLVIDIVTALAIESIKLIYNLSLFIFN